MKIKVEILNGATIEDVLKVVEICTAIENRRPLIIDPYHSYYSISFARDDAGRYCSAEVMYQYVTYRVNSTTTMDNLRAQHQEAVGDDPTIQLNSADTQS